jgi:hypothetical protein
VGGGWLMEIVPLLPDEGTAVPLASDATTPVTWMFAEASGAAAAMLKSPWPERRCR